ncbi:MAG: sigma 54-interacting transcriptional regulator [Burkholderiales bacterium]|nr:sigma 54-interacting transcriptional regulator [Burkholderiales bacterium]
MNLTYPPDADLRRLLRFSPDEGSIWLGDRRMVLLHTASLGELRRELVDSIGLDQARRVFTRMGFASGLRDAEFAKKTRGDRAIDEAFLVGPQLHMLEGAARVTPEVMEFDVAAGTFHCEFRWDDSWEAHAHREEFGAAAEASCWTLTGYASGYSSGFMGRTILCKEVVCKGCGEGYCRMVGRPADEWPEDDPIRGYFEADSLLGKIESLSQQVEALRSSLEPAALGNLIGSAPAFRRALDLLRKAAPTQVSVLLTGETGVGKERFARTLHELSERRAAPFVAVNCAALPGELIEAELFGVEKGAYTGAHAARAGRFERADGGTLFLDEVGELPLAAQAKLLRVLQEGEIERLGAEAGRKVNVRIVAATNVDLEEAVAAGRFRRDLLYRLNVYPIRIPALRERPTDIEPLARAMLQRFSALHCKRIEGIGERALQALARHGWPGNVRELENLIERGVILAAQGGRIEAEDLFPNAAEAPHASLTESGLIEAADVSAEVALCEQVMASGMTLERLESRLLEMAVASAKGNLSGAARSLGLTRPQLAYRIKRQTDPDAAAREVG